MHKIPPGDAERPLRHLWLVATCLGPYVAYTYSSIAIDLILMVCRKTMNVIKLNRRALILIAMIMRHIFDILYSLIY